MPNELDSLNLRSADVQEVLEKAPRWMIRYGSVLILILVLNLLFISWYIKYPDVVKAEALVTTQTPPQKEIARSTGKLSHLLVTDNQLVESGQILAVIENAANYEDVLLLKSIIDTITVRKEAFAFPFEALPVQFLGELEASFALFENHYIQLELNRLLSPLDNDLTANKFTLAEQQVRLKNLQLQAKMNADEVAFERKALARQKTLFEQGVISLQAYEDKQLKFLQIEKNQTNLSNSISSLLESIASAKKNHRGTEIQKIRQQTTLLKNAIQSFNQLKKNLRDWERNYLLKAEMKGYTSFSKYWTIGQQVNQGDLVFTIIPYRNDEIIVKLKSPAKNSGKIKVGQRVNLKIDNYPHTEFGMVEARIEKIASIADKEQVYLIAASLPRGLQTSYRKELPFKQEMIGNAEIITEDLRLLERFFYQFLQVFNNS